MLLEGLLKDPMGMGWPQSEPVVEEAMLPTLVPTLRSYEDLITKDLLEHLTKTYRVSKRRDQRAIMGISMGGMGALKIALKNPELFGTVSAHSSAVLPPDPKDLPPRFMSYAKRIGIDRGEEKNKRP